MERSTRAQAPTLDEWEWQFEGACRSADPNLFFHPEGERGYARRRRADNAKKFCGRCDVIGTCLERSLESREAFGVWGGLSEDERRAMLDGRVMAPNLAEYPSI